MVIMTFVCSSDLEREIDTSRPLSYMSGVCELIKSYIKYLQSIDLSMDLF